jgi:hypothetical protein
LGNEVMNKAMNGSHSGWVQFLQDFEREKCTIRHAKVDKHKIEMKMRLQRFLEDELGDSLEVIFEKHAGWGFDAYVPCVEISEEVWTRDLFGPVIRPIAELVVQTLKLNHDAIGDKLKALVLVGGFANSIYLREAISKVAKDRGLEFLFPEQPSLTVLKGAVHFGVNPLKVQARVSQRSYGVKCMVPFVPGTDPEDLIYVEEEKVFCRDVFDTILSKGTVLLPNAKWSETYTVREEEKWELQLFAHDENPESVRHFRSAKIEKVGLPIDLPGVERGETGEVTVEINFGGTQLEFAVIDSMTNEKRTGFIRM